MTRNPLNKILSYLIIGLFISALGQGISLAQGSSNQNDYTLLIFSGSDWCIPCIRFDKDVRQDPDFIEFSQTNLTVVVADFPQHKKLDRELIKTNEKLAEKYNPTGIFPLVLLLDTGGNILTTIRTNKVTAQDVINQIEPFLPKTRLREFNRSEILMGSAFHFTIVADEQLGEQLLTECINQVKEIESWLSGWKQGSITTTINNNAAMQPVEVTDAYYQLLNRCINISKLTQGAFDISFNGLESLYSFDGEEQVLPSKEIIAGVISHIGYEHIQLLDNNKVVYSDSLLKIGFGAIGKGYAAEQVKKSMIESGVTNGVINASGDLTTWGKHVSGESWKIGIPDPENRTEFLLWLPLDEKAIATSGDYEKYFMNNGTRYSHIINPKTGLPVIGSSSVSVISPSAELSDALATAVSVLGVEVGMDLINQLDGVECVFVDNNRKLHFSTGLETYEN